MKKNSPYTKFFKRVINELSENGDVNILKLRYTKRLLNCGLESDENALGFLKLAPLFVLLCFGICLSFITSAYEYCKCKKKSKERQKNHNHRNFHILQSSLSASISLLEKSSLKEDTELFLEYIKQKYETK